MRQSILYIAGYGRSGSTVLERILSAHPELEGLGEVEYLTRSPDIHTSVCGCGRPLQECPVWGPALASLEAEFDFAAVRRTQNSADAWRPGASTTLARSTSQAVELPPLYRLFLSHLFEQLAEVVSPEVRYLIDSSKTARENFLRPFSLQAAGARVKMIHLVRDGRGCMWSYMSKGSNRRIENDLDPHVPAAALRASLSWNLANRAAELFGRKNPGRYLRLRYEDLVADPEASLRRLEDFLEVDLSEERRRLAEGETFPPVHQVAGNRLRHEAVVRLMPDTAWQTQLPSHARALFWAVNWARSARYGYRFRPGASTQTTPQKGQE